MEKDVGKLGRSKEKKICQEDGSKELHKKENDVDFLCVCDGRERKKSGMHNWTLRTVSKTLSKINLRSCSSFTENNYPTLLLIPQLKRNMGYHSQPHSFIVVFSSEVTRCKVVIH